jgi:hypothetical protein
MEVSSSYKNITAIFYTKSTPILQASNDNATPFFSFRKGGGPSGPEDLIDFI